MHAAFTAAFASEEWYMTIKKCLFRIWPLKMIFFIAHCKSWYDVKPNAQSKQCTSYCSFSHWVLQKLDPSAIDKCAVFFVPPLAIEKIRNWGIFSTQLPNLQTRAAFTAAFTSEEW
jgi:hypothetical protein